MHEDVMMRETLEQERKKQTQNGIRFTIYVSSLVVLAALFFLGVIKFDFSNLSHWIPQGQVEQEPESIAPRTQLSPAPIDNDIDNRFAGRDVVETSPQAPHSGNQKNSVELRDRFKEVLASFENNLEPEISSAGFTFWNKSVQRGIFLEKEKAILSFSEGQYNQALLTMAHIDNVSLEEITKKNMAFNESIASANTFYNQDNFGSASLMVERALRLNDTSEEAIALKSAIEQLPKVLDFLAKAATAKIEGNLELEVRYLKAAYKIDPSRAGVQTRLGFLEKTLLEQRFSENIEKGIGNVEQKHLHGAEIHLNNAMSIFPARSEIELLSKKVQDLGHELELDRLVREAHHASKSDNWIDAANFYEEATVMVPNNKAVVEGYALANKINASNIELTKYLKSPHRLSSRNVARLARVALSDAEIISEHSNSLRTQAKKLKKLLNSYDLKVSVLVISDGSTNVSIQGVGKIGVTTEKIIELRPGKYTFEGARVGHRSKVVEADIPPGVKSFSIEIYCDERL